MKLYISGPMAGLPNNNADAFNEVAKILRDAGHEVFNPVEKGSFSHRTFWPYDNDVEWHEKNKQIKIWELSEPERRIWLRDDIYALSLCDGIVLLPGWADSSGARAERAWADAVKMPLYYWDIKTHHDALLELAVEAEGLARAQVLADSVRDAEF